MTITPLSRSDLSPPNWQHPISQRIVLKGVSWPTYQTLLAELGEHRAACLAYAKGVLEITMPSKLHEIINRILARIVATLTEELNLSLVDFGSTTLDREDLAAGIEPDSCFYIQNADRVQGLNPDLPKDLPPDLAIEVDITSSSSQRLPIYQQLAVPELWRYHQSELTILHWQNGTYVLAEFSLAFPMLSAAQLTQFIQERQTLDDNGVVRAVRTWIRTQQSCI